MARRIREAPETLGAAEQKVLDTVPGKAIPIIKGGMSVGAHPKLGPPILVEITDMANPKNEGSHYFGFSSRGLGVSWEKELPLGKPVLVPELVVKEIESGKVERNVIRIGEESAMHGNPREAEAHNPGMRYVENEDGAFLTRVHRRWIVRRVSPDEMRAGR